MHQWTVVGELILDEMAHNAALFTKDISSAQAVYLDVQKTCDWVAKTRGTPNAWQKVTNAYGKQRYWHLTDKKKIVIWKLDVQNNAIFVGVYYSMPSPLHE